MGFKSWFEGCAIRHTYTVMRLLVLAPLGEFHDRVTRWGLFLRHGATLLFFESVAYGKAATHVSQMSCHRDQTPMITVSNMEASTVVKTGRSNDDISINRVKHLDLHDL